MYFPDILDKPYCVYGHFVADTLLYIGSGKISRAFECTRAQRNPMWHLVRAGRPVSVRIFATFTTCNEARRAEYSLIGEKDPPANKHGRIPKKIPRSPKILLKARSVHESDVTLPEIGGQYPKPKALKSFIEVRDGLTGRSLGRFPSIKEASQKTQVSQGAISSSITKRYPIVRGMTFHRMTP